MDKIDFYCKDLEGCGNCPYQKYKEDLIIDHIINGTHDITVTECRTLIEFYLTKLSRKEKLELIEDL